MLNATSAFMAAEPINDAMPAVGPDAVAIALQINGVTRTVRAEPHMTLAEALRGPLEATEPRSPAEAPVCL